MTHCVWLHCLTSIEKLLHLCYCTDEHAQIPKWREEHMRFHESFTSVSIWSSDDRGLWFMHVCVCVKNNNKKKSSSLSMESVHWLSSFTKHLHMCSGHSVQIWMLCRFDGDQKWMLYVHLLKSKCWHKCGGSFWSQCHLTAERKRKKEVTIISLNLGNRDFSKYLHEFVEMCLI